MLEIKKKSLLALRKFLCKSASTSSESSSGTVNFALDVESARVRFLSWVIVVSYEKKYSPKLNISEQDLSALEFFTVDLLTVNFFKKLSRPNTVYVIRQVWNLLL